jgi:copper resistance protein B
MPAAVPSVAIERDNSPEMQDARHMSMIMHGDSLNFLLLGDRVEQTNDDALQWDLQGWLGYDRDRLWIKTEGEHATGANGQDRSEVQLLYGRAVSPYWDVQAGLRRDDAGSTSRNYAVLGAQGLAPFWFELDAAVFLSEQGDLSARFEAEYELRFTQRLLLQPRLELNYSFADDPALGVGEGMNEANFGLRLRYELRREFAPYVGVEWARAFGGTADLLRAAGEDRQESRVVAGIRFWY